MIWQMWQPGRAPISSARTPWREALHQPGSRQVGYARRLLESRRFASLVPDQALLAAPAESGPGHPRAARTPDGACALAYSPLGRPLAVRLDALGGRPGARLVAWWFDPRTGTAARLGELPAAGTHTFDPPGEEGRGHDWVLVLDRADVGFPPPGAAR